jgi:hypothetical protein
VGGALIASLALWLVLLTALTSISAAAAGDSACFGIGYKSADCTSAFVSMSGAKEEEGEEGQAEEDEGASNEEAASAEAEAEEAASGMEYSSPAGSRDESLVVLSHLRLTAKATAALEHRLPFASAVGFSFTLSAPAKVRVTLVKQTSIGGRKLWAKLPDSLALSLAPGHVADSLKGHNRLTPGRYRLTVKPANGHSYAIYLSAQR